MSNARHHFLFLMLLLGAVTNYGCGKKIKQSTTAAQAKEVPGVFWSSLNPVNPRVESNVTGSVKISRFGDSFSISVTLRDAPNSRHLQALHLGDQCPDLTLDRNYDGFVDSSESFGVTGLMILPMDSDISFQGSDHAFPRGSYSYAESTSYSLLLSDLHEYDEVFNDGVAKLSGGDVPLSGKVVVIYGIDSHQELPPTTSRLDGNTPHESVPIACGKLALIAESPEEDNPPSRFELPYPTPDPIPPPSPEDNNSSGRTIYDPGSGTRDENPDGAGTWWGTTRRRVGYWWCRLRRCEKVDDDLY